MRIGIKHILSTLVLCGITLLFSRMMPAQNLTQLKPELVDEMGTLANGITYQIKANSSSKGFADFALIQRGIANPSEARANLSSLKSFGKVAPYAFLSRNGIGPDKTGYIRYQGDATIYNFTDVPISSASVVDSLLLMMFGIADTYSYEQDIVIVGDITSKTILEKLKVMSMMVAKRDKNNIKDEYQWEDKSFNYVFRRTTGTDAASVSANYLSPRSPRESMNTAQPIVVQKFSHELGTIIRARLSREMSRKSIPFSGVEFKRRSSADGPDDEMYGVTIFTDTAHVVKAASVLASTLAYLKDHGASKEEYEDAKYDLFSNAGDLASTSGDNTTIVNKCIASYLYGADLASDKTITSFFTSRELDSAVELSLFNDFVSALLDKEKNLTLRCVSSNMRTIRQVNDSFSSGWDDYHKNVYTSSFRINSADTLGLDDNYPKVKIKTTESEPLTSGEIWTFSNGMKVIFKRNVDVSGKFSFALLSRGNYADLAGIDSSKEKYLSDMLSMYDVAGLQSYDFRRMLEANGIKIFQEVSSSGLSVKGTSSSSKLTLLLKSLLALSSEREFNESSYGYYCANTALSDKDAKLDEAFAHQAQKYYTSVLSSLSDGYLVLIGDLNPVSVKKILTKYCGGFVVGSTYRSKSQKKEVVNSGCTTEIKDLMSLPEGNVLGVSINMSAPVTFTAERLMTLRIAQIALQRAMVNELAPLGMYVESDIDYSVSLPERFSMRVSCNPCAVDGLPEGITAEDPITALVAMRKALEKLSSKNLSNAELQSYKALLTNNMQSEVKTSSFMVDALQTRLLDGKDIMSDYTNKIKAVSADMVKEILSSLNNGYKIEEVIR